MTRETRNSTDRGQGPAPEFARDLRVLYRAEIEVPPSQERELLEAARRQLGSGRRPRARPIPLWVGGIAAAAAILLVARLTMGPPERGRDVPEASRVAGGASSPGGGARVAPEDLDANGRVDILDAFLLARHVQSRSVLDRAWDLNGDGRVDRGDVDNLALAAVRLR